MDKDFYTVKEAAEILRVCDTLVYEEIQGGRIHAVRIGKRRLIVPAKSIRDFAEKEVRFDD